jgi:hypothetical protein
MVLLTIATTVTPFPDEGVLMAAAAKKGFDVVKAGRNSYHIYRNGQRLTGEAERNAAKEIFEEAGNRVAPSSVTSLMRGRRAGEVVSDAGLDQLERGLLRDRITLTRNADVFLESKNAGGLVRVYKDGSASLFLRKNATRYEILHESQHIEHLRQIGAQRYIELSKTKAGNLELEQFVYDNLRRHHWGSLTPDEIKHAQWYIRDALGGNAW